MRETIFEISLRYFEFMNELPSELLVLEEFKRKMDAATDLFFEFWVGEWFQKGLFLEQIQGLSRFLKENPIYYSPEMKINLDAIKTMVEGLK